MTDTELLQALLREQTRTNELLEVLVRQQRDAAPAEPPAPPPPQAEPSSYDVYNRAKLMGLDPVEALKAHAKTFPRRPRRKAATGA